MKHGTRTAYVHHGCRCEECQTANSEYARARRKKASLPDGDSRHGTVHGYQNFSCRCDGCKSAQSTANADYYWKRRDLTAVSK